MLFFQLFSVILLHTALANNKKEYYDVNNWESVTSLFESFLQEHDKNYVTIEKYQRLYIFRETLKEINRLNRLYPDTIYGITHFADLTAEEIKRYKGYRKSTDKESLCTQLGDPKTRDAPAAHDWRQHGAVTPVKDQKDCGSCWAFGATATVESRYAMKSGQQVDLSEQQLVDCNKDSMNCLVGGYADLAFTALIREGGQELEKDYPYKAKDGTCKFDGSKVAVKVASCNTYNLSSEDTMKELLFKEGPLTISIDVTAFDMYRKGIITDCEGANLDHCVQLIGYGSENGTDYWIIKNSWGADWGESGYVRVQRGVECLGILNTDLASVTLD